MTTCEFVVSTPFATSNKHGLGGMILRSNILTNLLAIISDHVQHWSIRHNVVLIVPFAPGIEMTAIALSPRSMWIPKISNRNYGIARGHRQRV
jgi:hypothetical protein